MCMYVYIYPVSLEKAKQLVSHLQSQVLVIFTFSTCIYIYM